SWSQAQVDYGNIHSIKYEYTGRIQNSAKRLSAYFRSDEIGKDEQALTKVFVFQFGKVFDGRNLRTPYSRAQRDGGFPRILDLLSAKCCTQRNVCLSVSLSVFCRFLHNIIVASVCLQCLCVASVQCSNNDGVKERCALIQSTADLIPGYGVGI